MASRFGRVNRSLCVDLPTCFSGPLSGLEKSHAGSETMRVTSPGNTRPGVEGRWPDRGDRVGASGKAAPVSPRLPIRTSVDRGYGRSACRMRWMASRDINVIALVKGGERYVFLFDDDSREETLRTLARYASNPELSFSWYDAAMLGQKVRGSKSHSRRHRFVPRADRPA